MIKLALAATVLLTLPTAATFAQTTHAARPSSQSGTGTAAKTGAVSGAKPTDAEVRKLFAVMGMRQQIENSMKTLFARALEQQTRQAAANLPTMDDADRNFFLQVQQQELAKVSDPAFLDSIMANSLAAYKNHLSAEDVRQLTVFYSSPAGQHYQTALPEISKEESTGVRNMIQSRGKQIIEDQQGRLQAYITKKQSAPAPAATPAPASPTTAPSAAAPAAPAGSAATPFGSSGAAGAETAPAAPAAGTAATTPAASPETPATAPAPPPKD